MILSFSRNLVLSIDLFTVIVADYLNPTANKTKQKIGQPTVSSVTVAKHDAVACERSSNFVCVDLK